MEELIFILGNTPKLGAIEIEAVLQRLQIKAENLSYNEPSVYRVKIKGVMDNPDTLINTLGGTVKIARVLPLDVKLTDIVTGDFGISDLTGKINIPQLCKEIKKETHQRFVLPKFGESQLSSVVVAKQNLIELIIGKDFTARTVAVQDFEGWNKRDYGRPEVEAHIGMLPPKVARIMVNLALDGQNKKPTVLDPFCGTGTIAAEAMMLGCKVAASDIDQRQAARTKTNLEWLVKNYGLEGSYEVYETDARQIGGKIAGRSVDAVVTEPYLGPNENLKYLNLKLLRELEDLYLACFEEWRKILKPQGRVVIVIPGFNRENNQRNGANSELVKNVVDKVLAMGYSLTSGPFVYARPQAKVIRNICSFKFQI